MKHIICLLTMMMSFHVYAADSCLKPSTNEGACSLDADRLAMMKDYLTCREYDPHSSCIDQIKKEGVFLDGIGYFGMFKDREAFFKNLSIEISKSEELSEGFAKYMVAVAFGGGRLPPGPELDEAARKLVASRERPTGSPIGGGDLNPDEQAALNKALREDSHRRTLEKLDPDKISAYDMSGVLDSRNGTREAFLRAYREKADPEFAKRLGETLGKWTAMAPTDAAELAAMKAEQRRIIHEMGTMMRKNPRATIEPWLRMAPEMSGSMSSGIGKKFALLDELPQHPAVSRELLNLLNDRTWAVDGKGMPLRRSSNLIIMTDGEPVRFQMQERLRPSKPSIGGKVAVASAALTLAQLVYLAYSLDKEEKVACQDRYPFVTVEGNVRNSAGETCRPVPFKDVSKDKFMKPSEYPKEVISFLRFDEKTQLALLNTKPGKYFGVCDYYTRIYSSAFAGTEFCPGAKGGGAKSDAGTGN